MSFQKIHEYLNFRMKDSQDYKHELAAEYGTENFSMFMYALVKMAKPKTMLELGTGAGITSFLAAQAMKENGFGTVYTVDDASQWSDISTFIKEYFQAKDIDYRSFINLATKTFDIGKHLRSFSTQVSLDKLFMPDGVDKLDIVYIDCLGTNVQNVAATLAYYLPRLNLYSSLFWDNASTFNHTFLFFDYVVRELSAGKVPVSLLKGLNQQEMIALETMVRHCKFTLVHLTDDNRGKVNKHQNSRTWLKIDLNDFIPHGATGGGVTSY